MGKIKTIATVFELPQKLGILQYVEHEPERCADCLYAGLLTAEGCRRGVCIKYRVWVFSRDRRRWEAKERWRRRNEEAGGQDCDVYYYVYPVKRSQRGPSYYYSPEWRTLQVQVPDRFLEKLADHVVLRDGKIVKVQKAESSGKYVTLTV
jgi:hypothetical protein